MLNQDHAAREFEFAVQAVVAALGGPALGEYLGIKPGYVNRMANPHDEGAFFRAKDLLPLLRLAMDNLEPDAALAPLKVLARALGQALYPIMPVVRPADVIGCLSLTARHMGELGEGTIKAIDPMGEAGQRVTRSELSIIEISGHNLIAKTAAVMGAIRALHSGPITA